LLKEFCQLSYFNERERIHLLLIDEESAEGILTKGFTIEQDFFNENKGHLQSIPLKEGTETSTTR
jgi:hypothetical protein